MTDTRLVAREKRSRMFLFSDVHRAAEEFVEALSEHSDPFWHPEDKDELVTALTHRALAVLADPSANWNHDG